MKKIFFIFLAYFLVLMPGQIDAKDFGIVAVVNNDVVTNYELQNRISLAIGASGIKDTASNRARLALQTLENIIDEKLQVQEARRRKISITDAERERSIKSIEQQNGLKPGEFDTFIKKHKIKKETFLLQMDAQLTWQKLLLRVLQPKIYVSPEESHDFIDRLSRNTGENEVLISEILIPVVLPEQEDDAKKLAEKLVEELKSGADFAKFAKQFSRSNTAKNGGKIGWVPENDLEAKVRNSLGNIKKGASTEAIRTSAGYLIVKVDDRRSGKDKEPPDENKVHEFLAKQKLELEARKFMKNLRRSAYIERRI